MKRLLILFSIGIIGAIAVLRMGPRKEPVHVVDPDDKNFGAFPPKIPESQFDDMFV